MLLPKISYNSRHSAEAGIQLHWYLFRRTALSARAMLPGLVTIRSSCFSLGISVPCWLPSREVHSQSTNVVVGTHTPQCALSSRSVWTDSPNGTPLLCYAVMSSDIVTSPVNCITLQKCLPICLPSLRRSCTIYSDAVAHGSCMTFNQKKGVYVAYSFVITNSWKSCIQRWPGAKRLLPI
jgi:hypothetical protein